MLLLMKSVKNFGIAADLGSAFPESLGGMA